MNSRITLHCAWAAVAVAAFFAGALGDLPTGPAALPNGAETGSPANRESAGPDELRTPFPSDARDRRAELAGLAPDEMKARVFSALNEPTRWKRMLQVMELFEHMTAENRQQVTEAFLLQIRKEGRTHSMEWELLKERVGEVAGREEIEAVLAISPKNQRHAVLTMRGWAGVDPAAARAWFVEQSPGIRDMLAGALLAGLARQNPQDAALFSLSLPKDMAGAAMEPMVDQIFQSGGAQGAADVLAALRAREDIPIERRQLIASCVAQRMRNASEVGGNSVQVLDWAAGYLGANSLIRPSLLHELLDDASKRDAGAAIRWMESGIL